MAVTCLMPSWRFESQARCLPSRPGHCTNPVCYLRRMSGQEGMVLWGEIEGRPITFPMVVPEVHIATAMFSVPLAAAAGLLPGTAFEVAETAPGEASLVIAACKYVDNPWGDYDEVNLGILAQVRSAGSSGAGTPEVGTFVWRMPVNQHFTCTAGNVVMGFPKTVEDIAFDANGDTVAFRLSCGGSHALTLTVPRAVASGEVPTRVAAETYSYLNGVPHSTTLEMDLGTPVDPAAVDITLGEGPIADELRSLGLPATPMFASWGESLGAVFHAAAPVATTE